MIDVLESIVAELRQIEGFNGRVYRKWPATKAVLPSCLVSRISATPTFTDAEGREILTQLVYSVDINASSADQADLLASEAIDRLGSINFHRTGDMDFYDDSFRAYRRILSFIGTVDLRGNTFTN